MDEAKIRKLEGALKDEIVVSEKSDEIPLNLGVEPVIRTSKELVIGFAKSAYSAIKKMHDTKANKGYVRLEEKEIENEYRTLKGKLPEWEKIRKDRKDLTLNTALKYLRHLGMIDMRIGDGCGRYRICDSA